MDRPEVFKLIEEHYRTHYKRLVSKYSHFVNSSHRAEDIVQEAYTRSLTYWEHYNQKEDFGAWFSGILSNCTKDNARAERLQGMIEYPPEEELVSKPSAIPAIIFDRVLECINRKPADTAAILHAALVEQENYQEVAQAHNKTENAVKQLVKRFRQEVKDEIKWRI